MAITGGGTPTNLTGQIILSGTSRIGKAEAKKLQKLTDALENTEVMRSFQEFQDIRNPNLVKPKPLDMSAASGVDGTGNAWFNPTALTAFREKFAALMVFLSELKLSESELEVKGLKYMMEMANTVAELTLDSAKMQAAMYIAAAVSACVKAIVGAVMVGVQSASFKNSDTKFKASQKGIEVEKNANATKTQELETNYKTQCNKEGGATAAETDTYKTNQKELSSQKDDIATKETQTIKSHYSKLESLNFKLEMAKQIANSSIDGIENSLKANFELKKGQIDAVKHIMEQCERMGEKRLDKAREAYKAADDLQQQIIQNLNQLVKDFAKAQSWSVQGA